MSNQQILFAETIIGLKKALARPFDASDSDDSIVQPTNRGNKLKRKAKYVHEGKLDPPNGPLVYKRKIEHAGYWRHTISRNPPKVDADGDEIDEEDESDGGDDDPYQDPYHGIRLEHLLCPLTSAAELPTHPSLSIPYYSNALPQMVSNAREMVHRENASLWRMKQLLTKFRGDDTWVPCRTMQTDHDIFLFGKPRPQLMVQAHLHQKGPDMSEQQQVVDEEQRPQRVQPAADGYGFARAGSVDGTLSKDFASDAPSPLADNPINYHGKGTTPTFAAAAGSLEARNVNGTLTGDEGHNADDVPATGPGSNIIKDSRALETNGNTLGDNGDAVGITEASCMRSFHSSPASPGDEMSLDTDRKESGVGEHGEELVARAEADLGDQEKEVENLMPLVHSRITRAQARASDDHTPQQIRSISPMSSDPIIVHPFFLTPLAAQPDPDYGLPQREADDVRKLLTMYVQKQEEIVRGAQALSDGLMRADRMRRNVLKWTKAEGHLGEMSDGEDWYDKEEWGLEEDLKKGHEEEDDEANAPGKKTRRARAER